MKYASGLAAVAASLALMAGLGGASAGMSYRVAKAAATVKIGAS